MKTIHLAIVFDDNYAEPSTVLITSILHNIKDENIYFHLLYCGDNEDLKTQFYDLKNCVVEFHDVDKKIFNKYKKSDYYPESMLWSMILPEVINTDKLIYIDCDVVVNSSLLELWEIDLEDNYIAAAEDANGKKYTKKFGLKKTSKFFNSGVMVLNSKKWRGDDISKQAVKFSMEHTGTRFGYDQTVLNILFEGKVKFLDLKWNLQYCPFNVWANYDNKEEYKAAIKNPCIIHYVGDFKPWKIGLGCFNPKQKEYLNYHKLTKYALEDYNKWCLEDKFKLYKGIIAFVKRYPLFFLRKQFWKNLLLRNY